MLENGGEIGAKKPLFLGLFLFREHRLVLEWITRNAKTNKMAGKSAILWKLKRFSINLKSD